jgi:tetratricopeptide (TPR) repeat protein
MPSIDDTFLSASQLFSQGKSADAIALLDALVEANPNDRNLRRRVYSATGACLVDVGRWNEARQRLVRAAALATELNDEVAQIAVTANRCVLHLAVWEYAEVLTLTDGVDLSNDAPLHLNNQKTALLLNRSTAALALHEHTIARGAAQQALAWLNRQREHGQSWDTVHFAIASLNLARASLALGKIEPAKEVVACIDSLPLHDRALAHKMLTHAVVALHLGHHDLSRKLLTSLYQSDVPDGIKRDALLLLLRVEQKSGNLSEVMTLLTEIGDQVIQHRSAQLLDSLHMRELAAPELATITGRHKAKVPFPSLYRSMLRITEASESGQTFQQRKLAARLAIEFAETYELGGSRFIAALGRGVMIRDFGSLSFQQEALASKALARESLRSTLRIFDAMGIERLSPEYRIAAFRTERADASGVLGISDADIPAEAQVASLCAHAIASLHASRSLDIETQLAGLASPTLTRRFTAYLASRSVDDVLDPAHPFDPALLVDAVRSDAPRTVH